MPLTASKTATWVTARARAALGGAVLSVRMLPARRLTQSVMTSARTGPATPSRAAAQKPEINSLRSMGGPLFKSYETDFPSPDLRESDYLLIQPCENTRWSPPETRELGKSGRKIGGGGLQYCGTEGSTWRLQAWMPPARL